MYGVATQGLLLRIAHADSASKTEGIVLAGHIALGLAFFGSPDRCFGHSCELSWMVGAPLGDYSRGYPSLGASGCTVSFILRTRRY